MAWSREGAGNPLPPPPIQGGVPPLPGFLPKYSGRDLLPGGGVLGVLNEVDQPTGPFFHRHVREKLVILEEDN